MADSNEHFDRRQVNRGQMKVVLDKRSSTSTRVLTIDKMDSPKHLGKLLKKGNLEEWLQVLVHHRSLALAQSTN